MIGEKWERNLRWAERAKWLTVAFMLLAIVGLLLFDCGGSDG